MVFSSHRVPQSWQLLSASPLIKALEWRFCHEPLFSFFYGSADQMLLTQVQITSCQLEPLNKMLLWTHQEWSSRARNQRLTNFIVLNWKKSSVCLSFSEYRLTNDMNVIHHLRGDVSPLYMKVDCNPGRWWLCILNLRLWHCIRHSDSCSFTGLGRNISNVDWSATGLIRGTSGVTCLSTAQAR